MNRFVCCGVVTEIRADNKYSCWYVIQDTWEADGRLGVETYQVHGHQKDNIAVGDVVFCFGTFGTGKAMIYTFVFIEKIGALLINNMLVSFLGQDINAAEEIYKDVAVEIDGRVLPE